MLKPTFDLTIDSLTSNSDQPLAGPRAFLVERDMDIPLDSLQILLMERAGIVEEDPLTLDLGHDGENELVFTGTVTSIKTAIDGVRLFALGKMNALLNHHTSTTYERRTAGDIVTDLVGQVGIETSTIDDGPEFMTFTVDRSKSAYAQIKSLADRLGFELFANRDGALMFRALGAAAQLDAGPLGAVGSAVGGLLGAGGESYQFGQNILSAHGVRRPSAWNSVMVGGESPVSWEGDSTVHWLTINDRDNKGEAGGGQPQLLVRDSAARTKDLADRFAAGYLLTDQRTTNQVQIRVLGRPQIDLGDTLAVDGMADDVLNGSGYVRAITHHFTVDGGYITDFRIGMGS